MAGFPRGQPAIFLEWPLMPHTETAGSAEDMRTSLKPLGRTCIIALVVSALSYPQVRPALAITNVTVIDVTTGARRTGVTVLIEDDTIRAVGHNISIPRGTTRLNGRASFLSQVFGIFIATTRVPERNAWTCS